MDFSQSFPPIRDGKTRPRTGFHFSEQKRPVLESSGVSLEKRPHLESRIKVARSLLVVVSLPILLMLGSRGAVGVSITDVLQFTT